AASWHTLILNQTFAAFALIIAALAVGARFYVRSLDADDEERDIVVPLLIGGANVLAIIALSAEVWGYFARIKSGLAGMEAEQSDAIVPWLVASANSLALVAPSAEALGYYAVKMGAGGLASETRIDLHLAQQLSLSVVWAIYGGAMLTVGIARRSKLLRVMAL